MIPALSVAPPVWDSLSDWQIIKEIKGSADITYKRDIGLVLFKRYEKLVHKHWHSLSYRMNHSSYVQEVKDDFYNESYITFYKALKAIDESKIKDENWRFVGYFGYYLNATKKTYMRRILKVYQNETPLEVPAVEGDDKVVYLSDLSTHGTSRSAEEEIIESDELRRLNKALKICKKNRWSSVQFQIFSLREQGRSIKEICTFLSVSHWKYNKLLLEMKTSLDKELAITR